jgi:hypothetical protein
MNRIQKIASEIGFNYEKNTCSGTYQGYRVSLIQNGSNFNQQGLQKLIVFPVDEMTSFQISELDKHFKSLKKEMSLFKWWYESNTYNLQIIETFKQVNTEKFEKILGLAIEAFRQQSVNTFSKCIFCKKEDPNIEARVYNVLYPAHQECLEKVKVATEQKKNAYSQLENKYPEGITGAIIGALLGIIPWVLVEIYTGFYAAVLAILIGFSAFFFYKKFGGKVTSATKYIIAVITMLAVLFTNVVVASYIILANDAPLIIENFQVVYGDPEVGPYLLQSLFLSIIIGALGLINVFRKVKSEEFKVAVD